MKKKIFDLDKMAFVTPSRPAGPEKMERAEQKEGETTSKGSRAKQGTKPDPTQNPGQEEEQLEIADVATLHEYISDAIENGLTLDPIWYALNRESLEYDEENTHIVELLGFPKNQKAFYVVKVDSENRYCDLLRKVSVLEYTMMNLQVISLLEKEQPGEAEEKNMSQPVKIAIVYAILESIMKILERGESVVTQGLFVCGDYLYPSGRRPSNRQMELSRGMSLYERMMYFAKDMARRYLEINLGVLENIDIDLSLPPTNPG